MHTYRAKWGEHHPLGNTAHLNIRKKYSTYESHRMLQGSTISSETILESELEWTLLILPKITPFIFLDVSLCVLWHI